MDKTLQRTGKDISEAYQTTKDKYKDFILDLTHVSFPISDSLSGLSSIDMYDSPGGSFNISNPIIRKVGK
jgi:hypothetical protein